MISLYPKKEIIYLNKSDLIKKDDLNEKIASFKKRIKQNIR